MELVLNGLQKQICLIYFDDIIVLSNNFKDHMQRLDINMTNYGQQTTDTK
jgi:hypothetical protein